MQSTDLRHRRDGPHFRRLIARGCGESFPNERCVLDR
jgi:hypothetical protein